MVIENIKLEGKNLAWILRCATKMMEFVGFTRCKGSKLTRFRHKSACGICILLLLIKTK